MTSLRQPSTPINVYSRVGDVEAGGGCVGSSPQRMAGIDSPRSSTAQSAPRSRFLEGFRRRRLQSENLPSPRASLDEVLGYPPICSPPPEDCMAQSAPDDVVSAGFRSRSKSDAQQLHQRHQGLTVVHKRQSGFLVVFPSSNSPTQSQSSSFNCASDGLAETGCLSRSLFNNHSATASGSKSFEGSLPQGSTPRDGSRPSPRLPLFVDTQLANGQKRSPVGSVIDFVRGRSRNNSVTLSGSLSGPNTPSSPQPVSARCSASSDGNGMPLSPLFSPGGRPLLSRNYRVGNRSLDSDSGLGMGSPSGAKALLIRERSLFNSFDSMTIGSVAADINTVFFDCQDAVYSLFMRAHKCYDLIPTSTKLVVFDTHLPVRKAFFALVYNGIRAAPLWDSDKQQFVGMLTITDFIKILIKHYEAGDDEERMRALEEEEISHWQSQFEQDGCNRPLVSIDPNDSLHRAVQVLCESKVHRLPVLDSATGNISYILTHKRIIKFLSLYINDLPRPAFMDKSPRELAIGSWGDILTIHVDTPLHDALEIFLKNRVSALPLVDEEGKVVDIYAKFDVISLAAEKSYDKLDCTVQEALTHRSDWFEGVRCCRASDSLFSVLEAIVRAEVHRLIVTDEDKKVVGIISLSDILKFLVLDPVVVDSSSTQEVSGEESPMDGSIPEGEEA